MTGSRRSEVLIGHGFSNSICQISRTFGTGAFIPILTGGVFSPDFYKKLELFLEPDIEQK